MKIGKNLTIKKQPKEEIEQICILVPKQFIQAIDENIYRQREEKEKAQSRASYLRGLIFEKISTIPEIKEYIEKYGVKTRDAEREDKPQEIKKTVTGSGFKVWERQ